MNGATLRMNCSPFVVPGKHEEQRVNILVNEKPLTRLVLRDPEPKVYVVTIPPGTLRDKNIISFRCMDAASPKSYGISRDSRKLGLAFQWLVIETR
jgi:hypothetical protein